MDECMADFYHFYRHLDESKIEQFQLAGGCGNVERMKILLKEIGPDLKTRPFAGLAGAALLRAAD